MSCSNDPQQLELPLSDQFGRFRTRIKGLVLQGISEELCTELRNWARFNDFPLVASWCRHLLREYVDRQGFARAGTLLESFGIAFRGDMVGHLGRDLLGAPLHSSNDHYRGVAISVLGRWLEYDQDGMWLEEAERHLNREEDEDLRARLWRYITQFVDEEYLPVDEDDEDPLLEEFLEVRRSCDIELRGTLPTSKLPGSLDRLLNIHPNMTLGILETLKVGHLCVRESNLGFYLSTVPGGHLLRVWDPEGSFAMSLEPTATEDRWLLFAYTR